MLEVRVRQDGGIWIAEYYDQLQWHEIERHEDWHIVWQAACHYKQEHIFQDVRLVRSKRI